MATFIAGRVRPCTLLSAPKLRNGNLALILVAELSERLDQHLSRWQALLTTEVLAFRKLIQDAAVPAIIPKATV